MHVGWIGTVTQNNDYITLNAKFTETNSTVLYSTFTPPPPPSLKLQRKQENILEKLP